MTGAHIRNLCPVCLLDAHPTRRGNIAAHKDSIARDTCPGSGEPWTITVTRVPEYVGVVA